MLNEDYKEMLSCFSDEKVEYLLVGAHALAVHGHPRATKDIDFFVRANADNAVRLIHALQRFGAPTQGLSPADFSTRGAVFQIGAGPRRIDILTSIDGVDFEDAYPRKVVARLEGIDVAVISRADLIANKRATGRTQDLADVERLTGKTRSRDDDLTR